MDAASTHLCFAHVGKTSLTWVKGDAARPQQREVATEGIMQFFELVETRRSVRAYAKTAVEGEKIRRILATALLAPSAGDLQAYQIAVIEKSETKAALAAAALGQDFVAEAPVILVFCANPQRSASRYGERGAMLYCTQDATLAACYAQLAATALGLASCWVGAFDETKVADVLDLPARLRAVAIMPIGYAAEWPERPPRRPLEDLVRREAS
jgi:nitroreductase